MTDIVFMVPDPKFLVPVPKIWYRNLKFWYRNQKFWYRNLEIWYQDLNYCSSMHSSRRRSELSVHSTTSGSCSMTVSPVWHLYTTTFPPRLRISRTMHQTGSFLHTRKQSREVSLIALLSTPHSLILDHVGGWKGVNRE